MKFSCSCALWTACSLGFSLFLFKCWKEKSRRLQTKSRHSATGKGDTRRKRSSLRDRLHWTPLLSKSTVNSTSVVGSVVSRLFQICSRSMTPAKVWSFSQWVIKEWISHWAECILCSLLWEDHRNVVRSTMLMRISGVRLLLSIVTSSRLTTWLVCNLEIRFCYSEGILSLATALRSWAKKESSKEISHETLWFLETCAEDRF